MRSTQVFVRRSVLENPKPLNPSRHIESTLIQRQHAAVRVMMLLTDEDKLRLPRNWDVNLLDAVLVTLSISEERLQGTARCDVLSERLVRDSIMRVKDSESLVAALEWRRTYDNRRVFVLRWHCAQMLVWGKIEIYAGSDRVGIVERLGKADARSMV